MSETNVKELAQNYLYDLVNKLDNLIEERVPNDLSITSDIEYLMNMRTEIVRLIPDFNIDYTSDEI